MAHRRRINNFPKAVLDRKMEVDHRETTMREFLQVNFYGRGVDHISANAVNSVVDLEVDQSIFIGIIEVKRIS